ncbi:hypothetical protein MKK75_05420 [Methylobacterium sp. J-030]|nr:hypothetical protein [Methylobacterium sp. J-030]
MQKFSMNMKENLRQALEANPEPSISLLAKHPHSRQIMLVELARRGYEVIGLTDDEIAEIVKYPPFTRT